MKVQPLGLRSLKTGEKEKQGFILSTIIYFPVPMYGGSHEI